MVGRAIAAVALLWYGVAADAGPPGQQADATAAAPTAGAAAASAPAKVPPRPVLRLMAGHWWRATIDRDGSGGGGYGAGPGVFFPPGTFDARAIEAKLRPHVSRTRPAPPSENLYAAEFFDDAEDRPGARPRSSVAILDYADGPGPIADIFELFRQACRQGKAGVGAAQAFGDWWREQPPTPVSRPWGEDGRRLTLRVRAGFWSAEANEDGSGSIACVGLGPRAYAALLALSRGSIAGTELEDETVTADLPPRTLDTPSIARRLRPELSATPPAVPPARGPMEANFFRDGRRQTLFANGPAPFADTFEAFRAACRQGRCSAPGRVEAAWKKNPPTPASKPWDAP